MELMIDSRFSLGILGLGVMGGNLARNFLRRGVAVLGYDPAYDSRAIPEFQLAQTLSEFTAALSTPRIILMMLPAGEAVEAAITSLTPYLQAGDLIIDGGNSYFEDTERRLKQLELAGIHFIGMGVSGGAQGALNGPSLMPGGAEAAWTLLKPLLERISATDGDGLPCVRWLGPGSAGHYVKMVHNGIEYAVMQLSAETYDLLHRAAGIPTSELGEIFRRWNTGELRSYLVEITATILATRDVHSGTPLVDLILDIAEQKGTGRWASLSASEIGVAMPTINAAVENRLISALKEERRSAARIYGRHLDYSGNRAQLVHAAEQALYAGMIMTFAQGLCLLRMASERFGWELRLDQVIAIWAAGSIIRADLLSDIAAIYRKNPDLPNLLLDGSISQAIQRRQASWRQVVQTAAGLGIPMPASSGSLAYFDAYRSQILPANLVQAQRDFFGAHRYRRVDQEGLFHTNWEETKEAQS